MNKKIIKNIFILIISLLLISEIAHAQETKTFDVALFLKDINTKEYVKEVLIEANVKNLGTNEELYLNYYLESNRILLNLKNGSYEIIIKVDKLNTKGKDYYSKEKIEVSEKLEKEIPLLPVGSLTGIVKDNLNNLVKGASLKFDCEKEYGQINPETTDKFGSFSNKFIPTGECKIIATYKDLIGSNKFNIKQGELLDIEIILEKSIVSESSSFFLIILIALIITAVAISYKKISKAKTRSFKKTTKEKEIKAKASLNKRAEDIIKTLNEREKQVVDHLLNSNLASSQAKIRYNTKIPKTSLSRVLESLKNKKIIEIDSIGKLKKVKLTSWFLEKE